MSQYRLTRRGKLVVIILLILITFLLVLGLRALVASHNSNQNQQNAQLSSQNTNDSADGFKTTISLAETTTSTSGQTEAANEPPSVEVGDQSVEQETTSVLDAKDTSTTKPTDQVLQAGVVTSEDERILLNASTLVLFEQDKAELSEDMKAKIREFSRTASAYSDFEITIRGVALKLIDVKKSEENAVLRAKAVSQYIASLGLLSNKIKIETKIVDHSDYDSAELSKAIAAELFFSGYQKEMK